MRFTQREKRYSKRGERIMHLTRTSHTALKYSIRPVLSIIGPNETRALKYTDKILIWNTRNNILMFLERRPRREWYQLERISFCPITYAVSVIRVGRETFVEVDLFTIRTQCMYAVGDVYF